VLDALQLLEVKSTLMACRDLKKSLAHAVEKAPHLAQLAIGLPEPFGIIDAITRVLSERGEVLDSASDKLANIRRAVRVARDRLMSRLQKYLTDSANKLQEPIITQRDGRYVIPLRAEFKGSIKAIVHDQSSSGATLFVEPLPVVELNNQVRELELAERDEERRILAELSALVGEHAAELKYGIENLALLDLVFAKAKYAEEIHASEPILHKMDHGSSRIDKPSTINHSPLTVNLLQTRHPLLDPNTVVPIDINPKAGTHALVITGPNTGGKTV
jgi:DNA mismatch repair protein MutS2